MAAPPLDATDPNHAFYDAFKRSDQYGTRGWAPQHWLEYVRLTLLGVLLVPLRVLGCLLLALFFNVVCRLCTLLPLDADVVVSLGQRTCRAALFVMGFWKVVWETDDTPYQRLLAKERGVPVEEHTNGAKAPAVGAIVSKNVSYLDIVVHATRSFPSFVACGNTATMPFFGVISRHLQCIFVDKEFKRGSVQGVAAQVKARAELAVSGKAPPDARPLLIFPEGITTNGECLLPFKTGAFLAGAPVQPVLLKFGPGRVSPAWESIHPAWHFFLMLANPTHSITATELPVYVPSREERTNPKLYAANVREVMLRAGGLRPSEASLVDNWAYMALIDGKQPPPNSRAGRLLAERGGGHGLAAGDFGGGWLVQDAK